MGIWSRILEDAKDRFTTWETVLGGVFVLLAGFIAVYPEYLVNVALPSLLLFIGFRWLLTNKYRAKAKDDEIAEKYRLNSFAWPLLLILALLPTQEADVRCKPCQPSEVGIKLIQRFEGYVPLMYRDAAGLWTIGYGHLMSDDEIQKYRGVTITHQEADRLFRADLQEHAEAVNRLVAVPLWQWQYDALTSFVYNVGPGNFRASTLRRQVNQEQHSAVPDQFSRWVYAGGKKLRGLQIRRNAEASLYSIAG